MKKLTKTFIAVAAVSAVSAAMAASAMAMTAEYADGTVTLKDVESTGASQTLLVLSQNETVTSENANNIVKQIDQKDDSISFSTVPVGTLADGTYYVRIGGTDGTLQTAEFKVGGTSTTELTFKIGDVDNDKLVTSSDAAKVAAKEAGQVITGYNDKVGTEYTIISGGKGSLFTIGDVDFDGTVSSSDAAKIAAGETGISMTGYNEYVGQDIKVSAAETTE